MTLPLAFLLFTDATNWFSHASIFTSASTGFVFVGLLFFSYSFASFLGSLFDAWGRKRVLLLSSVTIFLRQLLSFAELFLIAVGKYTTLTEASAYDIEYNG
jgi:MFS family permease